MTLLTLVEWAIAALSFAGTILVGELRVSGWVVWLVADAGAVVIFARRRMWAWVALYVAYGLIAVRYLLAWRMLP
jgi:phosphatidylglycerophosphate synthase